MRLRHTIILVVLLVLGMIIASALTGERGAPPGEAKIVAPEGGRPSVESSGWKPHESDSRDVDREVVEVSVAEDADLAAEDRGRWMLLRALENEDDTSIVDALLPKGVIKRGDLSGQKKYKTQDRVVAEADVDMVLRNVAHLSETIESLRRDFARGYFGLLLQRLEAGEFF